MEQAALILVAAGVLGLAMLVAGLLLGRRSLASARERASQLVSEAQQDAENAAKEIVVGAQEKAVGLEEEFDRHERDLEERENRLEKRTKKLSRDASELGQAKQRVEQKQSDLDRLLREAREKSEAATADRDRARQTLERVAEMNSDDARKILLDEVREQANAEGVKLARKIEEEARDRAERDAINLITQASQRVNLKDVIESTVTFIELPSDEMKGRIIGKEGRNIRAMEMATGIDLVVDDTPQTILISSFDPVRREVARVAIDRLVEDGRIHPARIEEVVQKAREQIDERIESHGTETAYELGISDLHPKLIRLVGRMRYHTCHGQNLLQHCVETALIAGHMAAELNARPEIAIRAGLLHEVGKVDDASTGHPQMISADLCSRYGEAKDVAHAVRALHPDAQAKSVEALLLNTANRLSENRPGARKENLAVFVERLRRMENIATSFAGVGKAYAIKAGKEIRVIVDATQARDENAYTLSKQIARALEKELNYPGQIKVSVVRETRAVRYAV